MRVYYQHPLINWRSERSTLILERGLFDNPRVELVANPNDAECIFLPCTFFGLKMLKYPHPFPPEKTLFVDWWDAVSDVHPYPCRAYFKRSWACSQQYSDCVKRTPVDWPVHFHPTSFSLLDEYLVEEQLERSFDISCFFSRESPIYYRNRLNVLQVCEELRAERKQLGVVGSLGWRGRAGFDKDFYRAMRASRIVVTCQPDYWEGDYRTWEAFASGALVVMDRMFTPLPHPFVDGEHCIIYDVDKDGLKQMRERVEYYVNHPQEAAQIAAQGFEHAMRYHRPRNRVDAMLDVWEGL